MADQMPLFDGPARKPRPVPKLPAASGEPNPRYTKYKPVRRVACDDCIRLVHQVGFVLAPVPAGARWTRRAGNQVDRLCHEHKAAREESEDR